MRQITGNGAEKERTLVSFDWAMKHLLRGRANPSAVKACFDLLEGFLSTLLNEQIRILSLLESEANQQNELDKSNRVDLLTVDSTSQSLLIELQYTWQPAYLKRLAYGASKLIVENINVSDPYEPFVPLDSVQKVVVIGIVYFPISCNTGEYLYYGKTEFGRLHNGNKLANDKSIAKTGLNPLCTPTNSFPEYYLIDVWNFPNVVQQPIDEWVYFFKNLQILDNFHSKNIQAAKEKLTVMQMSEADRKNYENFLLSRASAMDLLAGQLQEGIEQGKTEEKRENARKMRQEGLDAAMIARITGLSEAEIVALSSGD